MPSEETQVSEEKVDPWIVFEVLFEAHAEPRTWLIPAETELRTSDATLKLVWTDPDDDELATIDINLMRVLFTRFAGHSDTMNALENYNEKLARERQR